jgi:hypothetical protein
MPPQISGDDVARRKPLPDRPSGAPSRSPATFAYSISVQVRIPLRPRSARHGTIGAEGTGRGERLGTDRVSDRIAAVMVAAMPEGFDADEMIARFRERAAAVRRRGLPPVEGAERQMILRQMQLDFQDFAMLGDAVGSLEDGILTLRVDLRPAQTSSDGSTSEQG